jgi:hypothetical protein
MLTTSYFDLTGWKENRPIPQLRKFNRFGWKKRAGNSFKLKEKGRRVSRARTHDPLRCVGESGDQLVVVVVAPLTNRLNRIKNGK